MTAALTATPRPALYLVPAGGGRRAAPTVPVAGRPGEPLVALAAARTAMALGTLFAPVAAGLARALEQRAPLLVGRGRSELWAAAIVFLLAEQARLFEYDTCCTRTSFARELGSTLPTLRRRAATVRTALHPLVLELPDPDDEEDAKESRAGYGGRSGSDGAW